jgi:hypothetical protein
MQQPATRTVRLFPLLSLLASISLTSSSSTGLAVIRGFDVDFNSIVGKDWSPVLGDDFFPSITPRMVTNGTVALAPTPVRRAAPSESASDSSSVSDDDEELAVEALKPVSESESSAPTISASRDVVWTPAMKQAFERGVFSSAAFLPSQVDLFWFFPCAALLLIPFLGQRSVKVGSHTAGRNGLIAEYIRRQTGEALSRRQFGSFLRQEKTTKDSLRTSPPSQQLSLLTTLSQA